MKDSTPNQSPKPTRASQLSPDDYARLKAELKAPYRGLRQFIYAAFGASGLIGAFIFLMQLLAGRDVNAAFPNFALQIGVVALMVWLFRFEQRSNQKSKQKP
ncbi:DUF3493 domain-containing protein [Oculatella sp. LEGE 06141]|uniref:DUF3493 domain-containing protein n=1 Tax=Oculatella sp. LEGE 06141 TaxID=1828648 RepID=UPI00187F2DBA|nr:DUF3493 domain-containing protein [Oculatella sp. LEGE 06141]MBE9177623.1 DUF3493 domain-containing protein [Oculatella sp. LEGE 06141]